MTDRLTYRPGGGSVTGVPTRYIDAEEVIRVVKRVTSKYYRDGTVPSYIADDILFELGLKYGHNMDKAA